MALKLYEKTEPAADVEVTKTPAPDKDTSTLETEAEAVKAQADLSEIEQTSKGEGKRIRTKERTVTTSMLMEILKTAQGRTLSTVVLTVVAVAALILFAIAPALSTITTQVDKNTALQDKIQKMSDKYDNLNSLKTKQDSNQEAIANFDKYFAIYSSSNITGKMQKEIYSELSDLSTQNSFTFSTINFAEGATGLKNYKDLKLSDRLKFQKIKLNITGSRSNLPNLLTAIESQKRIYHVENIAITTTKESGSNDTIDLTLDTIFWQLPS